MTDQEQAEAVVNGLANMVRCECGRAHNYAPYHRGLSKNPWKSERRMVLTERVDCDCGNRHGAITINCKCGVTWGYGPVAGWRIVSRKAANWRRVIQELRDRVANLEKQVAEAL